MTTLFKFLHELPSDPEHLAPTMTPDANAEVAIRIEQTARSEQCAAQLCGSLRRTAGSPASRNARPYDREPSAWSGF